MRQPLTLFHQSGNILIMIAPELLDRLNQIPGLVDFGQKMLPFVRMPDVTLPYEERTVVYTMDAEQVVGRSTCIPRPAKVRMTDECEFACELRPPNGLPPKVFPVVTGQVGTETSLTTIILVPTAKPTPCSKHCRKPVWHQTKFSTSMPMVRLRPRMT